MKIKRIIAAVTALVLIGGAYPSFAEDSRNIAKTYAADEAKEDNVGVTAEDEKAPSFSVEKGTYKRREPYSVVIKNVDPASITFGGQNFVQVQKTSAEDGSLVYTFMSRSSGEAQIIVNYSFNGEVQHKEFVFNILEEEFEDENSPQFLIEKETYKRREPYSILVKNVDPESIKCSGINTSEVTKTTDENGNTVLTLMSRNSGDAKLSVTYAYDGEIRTKEFTFTILEEEFEDENYPQFLIEKGTYKRREPYSILVKNVDPESIKCSGINTSEVTKTTDENGNTVLTLMSRNSGDAKLSVTYAYDGEIRTKEFSFTILEEEFEDENYPQFLIEKGTYKRREPYSILVKNVDPESIKCSGINTSEVTKTTDENGNTVLTLMSRNSGDAKLSVTYAYDGEIRTKEFSFTILEEEFEDENYPQFLIEKGTYKRREPYSILVKNVDPESIKCSGINTSEVTKTTDENGNTVLTLMSRNSGEAKLAVTYAYDGEIRTKEFSFTILEEEFEDENYPQFLVEKGTYKRREPYSILVKNVDPESIKCSGINTSEVTKTTDENGNTVLTLMSRNSGDAKLSVTYAYDGEIRTKEFSFTILEEEFEDENYPQFLIEKGTYKRREPYSILVKNVDPESIKCSGINTSEVTKTTDENGNTVLTLKSKNSGEAKLAVTYAYDGEIRTKEFSFTILEEEFEDENYPQFLIEKGTYKRREPYSILVKNVDPESIKCSGINTSEVTKTTDENGNTVLTLMSRNSGDAKLSVTYAYDGEIRTKEFSFTILEEEFEDENYPQFLIEKGTYKRREPYSILVKNVDPESIKCSGINTSEVTKTTDENGNTVLTLMSRNSGDAKLSVTYAYDGEIRNKEFTFTILEEEYEEETTDQTWLRGDANCDGSVDMGDVVLIMQALANPNKYGVNGTHELHITQQGVENGDVDETVKGLTVSDALKIQKYLLDGKGTL